MATTLVLCGAYCLTWLSGAPPQPTHRQRCTWCLCKTQVLDIMTPPLLVAVTTVLWRVPL